MPTMKKADGTDLIDMYIILRLIDALTKLNNESFDERLAILTGPSEQVLLKDKLPY